MATTISTQDIVDVKRDIDDIGKSVNEKVIVYPRYGEPFKSLPMISAEFQISSDAAEAAAATAVSAAQSASSSANIAESAATSATISANVFSTPAAGVDPITGVADGAYFNVRSSSDESYIDEYQNIGGVATATGKSYPSSSALNNIKHNNLKDRDVSGAHPASAILYASGENLQDVNDVNKSTLVSIFDFMTMTQFRDWKASQETYDLTSVLQSAINAPDTYEVLLPQGTYLHSGLYCDKSNFRFYSNNYARSILKSDSTAAPALHIAKNVTGISGFFLDGIKLQGSPEATRAIQLGDATKYVQFCQLNNCMIDGFTKSDACDIYLGSVQELDIVNTMSWRGNIGIYKAQGGYGTSVKISGKAGYLGRHAKHGIKLDGQIDDIYVQDSVIEGNGLEAIYISDTAFKNTQGVTIYLQNAYFEANAQTGVGAGVIYAKGSSTYLKKHKVYIDNCNFADNPNAPAGFKDVAGEWLALSISGTSNILPGDVDVTNSEITFTNNQSVSSGDIFASLKALRDKTGNKLFATGFDYVNSKQANFMSSITFPTTANLSTDANTLDDYREVDFTPTVTGHGGTVSVAVGKYTKVGRLVNFAIQLTTQNFTSTQGTTKVSLPHTQVIGAVAQFLNNQSYAGGVALIASQAVNLPTLAAQGSSATIYITGQYTTAQ